MREKEKGRGGGRGREGGREREREGEREGGSRRMLVELRVVAVV